MSSITGIPTLARAAALIAALALFGGRWSSLQGQDMLGQPLDRIDYSAESSEDLVRPDSANCGYSGPNGTDAVYHVEQRHYKQWQNGVMVRGWISYIDVFDRCLSPDATQIANPRPDGINYTILEATEVPRPGAAECPGDSLAIYRRETRQYGERRNGVVVRRWRSMVDVFDRCSD